MTQVLLNPTAEADRKAKFRASMMPNVKPSAPIAASLRATRRIPGGFAREHRKE
jgi:hypothetical protein